MLAARQKKVAEKQAPIEEALKPKYAECVELVNQLKALNPDYKAPWEVATPLMLGHAIKDWLAENGGSAKTPDIVSQFNHLTSEQEIREVLLGRTKGGKYRLWDYNETKDIFTLKSNTNTKNNQN